MDPLNFANVAPFSLEFLRSSIRLSIPAEIYSFGDEGNGNSSAVAPLIRAADIQCHITNCAHGHRDEFLYPSRPLQYHDRTDLQDTRGYPRCALCDCVKSNRINPQSRLYRGRPHEACTREIVSVVPSWHECLEPSRLPYRRGIH